MSMTFLFINENFMLLELKRTVSMRRYFWAHKTLKKKLMDMKNHNFTLKNLVYLDRFHISKCANLFP